MLFRQVLLTKLLGQILANNVLNKVIALAEGEGLETVEVAVEGLRANVSEMQSSDESDTHLHGDLHEAKSRVVANFIRHVRR